MAAEVMAASKVQAKSPLIVDPSLIGRLARLVILGDKLDIDE
jgi:hypothetical protein